MNIFQILIKIVPPVNSEVLVDLKNIESRAYHSKNIEPLICYSENVIDIIVYTHCQTIRFCL
jgi:hypothetical protein